jgi:hypothetical protein
MRCFFSLPLASKTKLNLSCLNWTNSHESRKSCDILTAVTFIFLSSYLSLSGYCFFSLENNVIHANMYQHLKMFGSSFPPVVCKMAHVLFWCLCMFAHRNVQHLSYHGRYLIRGRNCLPFVCTWVHPLFWMGSVLLIVLILCVVSFALFVFVLCLVLQFL